MDAIISPHPQFIQKLPGDPWKTQSASPISVHLTSARRRHFVGVLDGSGCVIEKITCLAAGRSRCNDNLEIFRFVLSSGCVFEVDGRYSLLFPNSRTPAQPRISSLPKQFQPQRFPVLRNSFRDASNPQFRCNKCEGVEARQCCRPSPRTISSRC